MPNPHGKRFPSFRKVTDTERVKMRELYLAGDSSYEVGAKVGRSFKTVLNNLRKMGVPIRDDSQCMKRYSLNETYFDQIDTPEKAYLLGFIYADGNVKGNRLKIALWEQDRYVLKAMAQAIGFDGNLYTDKATKPNRSDMAVLTVFGRAFCDHLKTKGVMESKTQRIALPTFLSDELLRFFVLGYFDGDGTVTSYLAEGKEFRWLVGFAGHEGFIRSLQEYFQRQLGVRGTFTVGSGNGRAVNFNCIKGLKVLNFLYQSLPPFFLTRKYDRFKAILARLDQDRARKARQSIPHIDSGLQIVLANAA